MACRFAKETDQFSGWECRETEGACMFSVPDEKRCYDIFQEGPLAFEDNEDN